MTPVRKAVVALALATAGVGGGIGLANAQTTPTTPPTTVAPDDGGAPDAPEDRENCPHKDGGRGPGDGRRARPGAGTGGASRQT